DYGTNTYIVVYLSPSSPYLLNPSSISTIHPALTHVGSVGVLNDVQLVSVPKREWSHLSDDVLVSLRSGSTTGIEKVEVQDEPKTRAKR
ncbi:hypothetical protein K439DRAFT_1279400, partial [Ramaria rubella]